MVTEACRHSTYTARSGTSKWSTQPQVLSHRWLAIRGYNSGISGGGEFSGCSGAKQAGDNKSGPNQSCSWGRTQSSNAKRALETDFNHRYYRNQIQ